MGGKIRKGLEGVVVGESRLGNIDGNEGKLWYCGYDIDDLVKHASYEEVLYLLLHQQLPTQDQLAEMEDLLREHRDIHGKMYVIIESMKNSKPMDVLRTAVSMLAGYDDDPDDLGAVDEKAVKIIAKIPTILAALYRYRQGKEPIDPDNDLSHAANFLYMMHGEKPSDLEADAMDAALMLYAEHGMNASTFAGVVTVSTEANVYSSLCSAIGALQGPLHGGATETVMEMVDGIGGPENAEERVDEKLDAHEKIPGFGHRVYKAVDPRCKHFGRYAREIADDDDMRIQTIEALRDAVEERLADKDIWPNADLYSGSLYAELEIPPAFYTSLFAMARSAGWAAHIKEQLQDNRIFRPRIRYVGDLNRDFIPLDDR